MLTCISPAAFRVSRLRVLSFLWASFIELWNVKVVACKILVKPLVKHKISIELSCYVIIGVHKLKIVNLKKYHKL